MMLITFCMKSALVLNIAIVLMCRCATTVHGWPEGTFGLPMPKTGCPIGRVVDWETGSRAQRTEQGSHASDNIHLAGIESTPTDHIVQLFCMKMSFPAESDLHWMPGHYCILKKGGCPANFADGFIYWDDAAPWFGGEDTRQSKKGVLPDGSYNQNTKVEYCCRNDGPPERPIQLPSSAPFYLFKLGDICQEVEDMYVNEEWVYWSDESSHNLNAESGVHPRVIRSKFSPVFTKLFYCYYQPKPPSIAMATVRNVAYAIVGLVGLLILVTVVVCITVHICRCYERRRRKRSDAANDACSRPSVSSSAAVNCQYVTLQLNDSSATAAAGGGVPAAVLDNAANLEAARLQSGCQRADLPADTKPPSYSEVMGYQ